MTDAKLNIIRWGLVIAALFIPLIAWGSALGWQLSNFTLYQYFPLFGMWGYFLMVTHFIVGAIRAQIPNLQPNKVYSTFTEHAVLACIILHPVLLSYILWQDNYGIPPLSFYEFVGTASKFAIVAGSVGLFIFLSFEILRRSKNSPLVKKYWVWILLSQVIAMGLIFYHGLTIGSFINGWFLAVWWCAGICVAVSAVLLLKKEHIHAKNRTDTTKN